MILRRFMQHIKEQNWFAVGLDVIVVIVGIFLGMQVQGWYEEHELKIRGQQHIENLTADIQSDLIKKLKGLEYYEDVHLAAERANDLLESQDSNPKELVFKLYRATEFKSNATVNTTWQEIISSGEVNLLPESDIRRKLMLYYFLLDTTAGFEGDLRQSSFRRLVRELIPHKIQEQLRERCSDVEDNIGTVIGLKQQCELTIPESELIIVANLLRENEELKGQLAYQFSLLKSAIATLKSELTLINLLLDGLTK